MSKFKVTPPKPAKIQEIATLAEAIENALDAHQNCDAMLSEMFRLTGCKAYDRDYFTRRHFHMSLDEFSAQAAYPAPHKIPDISRDDLIEIVQLAQENITDSSLEYYMALFEKNVVMPHAASLLFYPPENPSENRAEETDIADYDPSATEVVDYALLYKPKT